MSSWPSSWRSATGMSRAEMHHPLYKETESSASLTHASSDFSTEPNLHLLQWYCMWDEDEEHLTICLQWCIFYFLVNEMIITPANKQTTMVKYFSSILSGPDAVATNVQQHELINYLWLLEKIDWSVQSNSHIFSVYLCCTFGRSVMFGDLNKGWINDTAC